MNLPAWTCSPAPLFHLIRQARTRALGRDREFSLSITFHILTHTHTHIHTHTHTQCVCMCVYVCVLEHTLCIHRPSTLFIETSFLPEPDSVTLVDRWAPGILLSAPPMTGVYCDLGLFPQVLGGSKFRLFLFYFIYFILFFYLLVFQDRVLCVALAVLELSLRPGWPQTQKSTCLCLSSAGIKGERHHARLYLFLNLRSLLF